LIRVVNLAIGGLSMANDNFCSHPVVILFCKW